MTSDFDNEDSLPAPNWYPSDQIPTGAVPIKTRELLNKEVEQHEIDDMQRRQRAYEIARQLVTEAAEGKDARGFPKRTISIKEQLEEERKLAKFMLGDEY